MGSRHQTIALLGLAAVLASAVSTSAPALAKDGVLKRAARGELTADRERIKAPDGTEVEKEFPFLSAGLVEAARETLEAEKLERSSADEGNASGGSLGISAGSVGCGRRNTDGNVRVNQDCTFRRQAEEIIKANPAQPENLIAGQNDSRVGFNHCGFDFSFDSGKSWGDGQPPFFNRLNNPASQEPTPSDRNRHTIRGGPGTDHTYDAASDPALAFDSQGRAFYSCIMFDVITDANAIVVTQSPVGAGGSFYDNLPAGGRTFIVAEDNQPSAQHDKEFLASDTFPNSPNRDNVYVTWTVFNFTCGPQHNLNCESPIFGSMSTNHGLTWSTPEEISGRNPAICVRGDRRTGNPADANKCNFDQGSDPVVLPNGELEVVFINVNTPADSPNAQQLGVHCKPSGKSENGTAHLNCAPPVKVGDDVRVGEPRCNFGRGPEECIPGAFIRTNDFPRIAINRGNGHLYVTWQDYRTGEFDIQLTRSLDGGLTWQPAKRPVNPDSGRDHYFSAIDVVPSGQVEDEDRRASSDEDNENNGDHVGVSYFRTDRVPNENVPPGIFKLGQPGVGQQDSDYDLAGGRGLNTPFTARRISPRFPPPDGNQTGFNGDYSGLVLVGDTAHPIWSDTRNPVPTQFQSAVPSQRPTHDEDVFTDAVPLPDGNGEGSALE